MKKQIVALLCITSLLQANTYQPHHNLFHASTFENHADAWIKAYLFNTYGGRAASDRELQYIANLMYFSYLRSYETVRVQKAKLELSDGVWKGWQNIAKRRLNPSNKPPHAVDVEAEKQRALEFWDLYAVHQRMSNAYDETAKQVVHGSLLQTSMVKQGVDDMRKEARRVMLDALADIKRYLGTMFDYALKQTFKSDKDVTRGIGDFVMAYLPQLAVNMFIHADKLHNDVCDETWHTLCTIETIGVQTWQAIEMARTAFYKAHYTKLYRTMQQLRVDTPYFAFAFNEYGMLPSNAPTILLPDPDTLA